MAEMHIKNKSDNKCTPITGLYASPVGISLAGCSSAEPASVISNKTNVNPF